MSAATFHLQVARRVCSGLTLSYIDVHVDFHATLLVHGTSVQSIGLLTPDRVPYHTILLLM